jgi:5-methylcytosine-specific restriction endonuclease McrA
MSKKDKIFELRKKGLTFKEIGEKFGVSKQRVHAILNDYQQKFLFGRDKVREKIRTRDNHTCKFCGVKWDGKGNKFPVHHKDLNNKKTRQYDRLEFEKNNLITLCHSCHINLHSKIRNPILKNPKRKEYYRNYYYKIVKQKRILESPTYK